MRVGIDAARQDVLAGSVDHLVGLRVERFADQGDPLAVDEDVGDVVIRRRDDAAVLDQHGHSGSPFSVVGYFPPAVSLTVAGFQFLPFTSAFADFNCARACFA